ncbi:MAG: UbiA family prenyltransferase [Actinomycetota bacterium]|nr:UbiA family prenyltransferase [Actinomycetota bacterium]
MSPTVTTAGAAKATGAGQVLSILRSSHPLQALVFGTAIALAAVLSGRPLREALVAGVAVLLAQAALGLGNDVADREYDAAGKVPGKPIAEGLVPVGNATFVIAILVLLVIPLSLQNGIAAGLFLLAALLVGYVHNRWLHRRAWSWVGWLLTFGLLAPYLSFGGWGSTHHGSAPTVAVTLAAAAVGVGVHFLTTLPDLVQDNDSGSRNLPLRVALKTGAPRLLAISAVMTAGSAVALVVSALTVGLRS